MTLRILTANLLHVHVDPESFGMILDREVPDVVCVQELGNAAAAEIASRYQYHDLHPTDDPHGMGIASGIAARFDRLPLAHTDAWRATLDDGTEILSVHVRNPIALRVVAANRQRRSQISTLVAFARVAQGRVVIAGDFNATPLWPAYRRLRGSLLDAPANVVDRQSAPRATWGPRFTGRRILRIDHLFTRGFRAVGSRVHPLRGSDRAAVVVDLEAGAA